MSAYALTVGLLVLPVARIRARVGHRTSLQIGLALFAVGTLLFGLAPSAPLLIVGRIVEGSGTAFVTPTMLCLLRSFESPGLGARAIGWWSGVSSAMTAVAPLLAALTVSQLSWRVYFIGASVAALTAVVAVSRTTPATLFAPTALPVGALLLGSVALGALDIAIFLRTPTISLMLLLTAVACAAAASRSAKAGRSRTSLQSKAFAVPVAASLVVSGLLCSLVFLVPFFDRLVLRLPTSDAVVSLVVVALPPLVVGPTLTRTIAIRGQRLPMTAGATLLAIAMALAARWTSHVHLHDTVPALALAGLGLAALAAPLTTASLQALPPDRLADGASLLACARMVGTGLGAFATSVLIGTTPTCTAAAHLCLDALSASLARPLAFDAGVAIILVMLIALAFKDRQKTPKVPLTT